MDHNVHHPVAVAKFTVIPGTELDKVSIEDNASPSFKGEVVGVTIKIAENNLVFSIDQDAFEGSSDACLLHNLLDIIVFDSFLQGPDPLLTFGKGYACVFPENCSKPVWIPARNIKLQQESKRETNQTNEDLAPGVTPCSCRQSTTSATEGSDSKQSTEDEEQEEDESDNKQPGGHLGHGKEDGTDA
ncbi:hypothetical protein QTO34_016704 [Cnephaeus nilssonii]|uniref:Integrase-type domain-containing protein n=1 Tax=Cnephaeus nilssonii TaxID=3371016 RepID=A0AA40I3M3_CNENI|nr:hypothetical protein QTO34_016704 [Eptesicus nilssonii]